MKKLILATLLIAGIASAGYSQERRAREKRSPEERAKHMTDMLDKKLNLSDKQRSEIYQVNLNRAKDMEKLHRVSREKREKDFKKSKKEFEVNEKKINRILTESQRKTYANLKTQRKEHMKHKRDGFKKRTDRRYQEGK